MMRLDARLSALETAAGAARTVVRVMPAELLPGSPEAQRFAIEARAETSPGDRLLLVHTGVPRCGAWR